MMNPRRVLIALMLALVVSGLATWLLSRKLATPIQILRTADTMYAAPAHALQLESKRDRALISTKTTFRLGEGPNDVGSSRYHLRRALEASLRRLGTDYVDIYHLHGFDALTPIEEVQDTLNTFVREGKVRYIACSNFSGWHLMKSLAVADRYGWTRYVGHQVYYSLIGREYEWELMPLGLDQKVGALVWSPLGWGRLTGKIRRGQPLPEVSRLHKSASVGPQMSDEYLYQ